MTYDLILFDLDDTLLDFRASQAAALAWVFADNGLTITDQLVSRFRSVNIDMWTRLEQGTMTKDEVLTKRFDVLFREMAVELDSAAVNDAFLAHLAEHPIRFPAALRLCEELSSNHKLGIVSNGVGQTQRRRIHLAGLTPFFASITNSEEVGIAKPHPAIFQHARRAAGATDDARVLMVGDNLKADIGGALSVGFDACWIDHDGVGPGAEITPTYTVRNLEGIVSIPFR